MKHREASSHQNKTGKTSCASLYGRKTQAPKSKRLYQREREKKSGNIERAALMQSFPRIVLMNDAGKQKGLSRQERGGLSLTRSTEHRQSRGFNDTQGHRWAPAPAQRLGKPKAKPKQGAEAACPGSCSLLFTSDAGMAITDRARDHTTMPELSL